MLNKRSQWQDDSTCSSCPLNSAWPVLPAIQSFDSGVPDPKSLVSPHSQTGHILGPQPSTHPPILFHTLCHCSISLFYDSLPPQMKGISERAGNPLSVTTALHPKLVHRAQSMLNVFAEWVDRKKNPLRVLYQPWIPESRTGDHSPALEELRGFWNGRLLSGTAIGKSQANQDKLLIRSHGSGIRYHEIHFTG